MVDKDPQIGKDVIESLTLGMYEDCRFIYREYIQNAADQIDIASSGEHPLMRHDEGTIFVNINDKKKEISIEDNATGISKDHVYPILVNIAHSTKKRGENKGFRGIGRLGGLGYCATLIFETSYFGEGVKSIMTWDANLMRTLINDRNKQEEASEVLKRVTSIKQESEDEDKHYFKVILKGVTNKTLLDVKEVRTYLSMVAPIEISTNFIFRSKIKDYMREKGLSVDTYNVYVNNDQIYKPYASNIYEDNNGGKKKVDSIHDIAFLYHLDKNGDLMYWGWYSLSSFKGQMKPINIARGIRLRCGNIQIGDAELCKRYFEKTDDQRFSYYFFGEIHAVSKGLIPNSRRDYFGESPECTEFETLMKVDFINLRKLCYDVSQINNRYKAIEKGEKTEQEYKEKEKQGFTDKAEAAKWQAKLEDSQKKKEEAAKQLPELIEKYKNTDSPINQIIDKIIPEKPSKEVKPKKQPSKPSSGKPTFITDKPIYSRFDKKEKKLISKIYQSIKNAIPEELSTILIKKIEEDITK